MGGGRKNRCKRHLSSWQGGQLFIQHADRLIQHPGAVEQLCGRAKESLEHNGGVDDKAFARLTSLLRYVAKKGSICVDGVSLTVNEVDDAGFEVALIPHTVAHTRFADTRVGDAVNLEIDLVARYVERLLAGRA